MRSERSPQCCSQPDLRVCLGVWGGRAAGLPLTVIRSSAAPPAASSSSSPPPSCRATSGRRPEIVAISPSDDRHFGLCFISPYFHSHRRRARRRPQAIVASECSLPASVCSLPAPPSHALLRRPRVGALPRLSESSSTDLRFGVYLSVPDPPEQCRSRIQPSSHPAQDG